jgi:hypothetical protein
LELAERMRMAKTISGDENIVLATSMPMAAEVLVSELSCTANSMT